MRRRSLKKLLVGMPIVAEHRVFTGVRPDGFSFRPFPRLPAPVRPGGEHGRRRQADSVPGDRERL